MAFDNVPNEDATWLQRVRDEIVKRGWTQKQCISPATGRVCILGAAYIVEGCYRAGHHDFIPDKMPATRRRLADALGWDTFVDMHGNPNPVTDWNDEPGRTLGQVLNFIDTRIQELA